MLLATSHTAATSYCTIYSCTASCAAHLQVQVCKLAQLRHLLEQVGQHVTRLQPWQQQQQTWAAKNKPFKAFMPGAVAHQGGGWVQLFKGSEDAVCILSPSVSPWMASFWLLPSWAAVFRPFWG
jgi:hypothetical protein